MKHGVSALTTLLLCCLACDARARPASWVEGTNYVRLNPVQHTSLPAGKIEVMEVFSYACPYCYKFQPIADKLERSLPPNAQLVFLPASFHPEEDWTVFQRAYFAAQALGIAARTHQAIFDAVWKVGGELSIIDPATNRLKYPLPSIEDAARCYSRIAGVNQAAFLAAANSVDVTAQMWRADDRIREMKVPGTPCLIVNGKYMVLMDSLHSDDDVVDLVKFLVAKESVPREGGR